MGIAYRLMAAATALLVIGLAAAVLSSAGPFGDAPGPSRPAATVPRAVSSTDTLIEDLRRQLHVKEVDPDLQAQLGLAHLQKVRETGDPSSYAAAEQAFQQALAHDRRHAEALRGLSALALARHDFAEALAWVEDALQLDGENARSYGLLGDALIELGRYDQALAAYQRMVDLRPDASSYARVAYARELHGDVAGAIEAMTLAVEAAGPTGEAAAWASLQLGHLYGNQGDLDGAQAQYERSLDAFPGYVHALAGLARVSAARGDYGDAIALYRQVVDRFPVPEYVVALGDVYQVSGRLEEAQQQYDLVGVIDRLFRANGVNSDLELALYYADHDLRLDEALRQARAEYQRRPSVQSADVLAWALYKSGRYDEALRYSDAALRLGTEDALLLFHAGMIRYRLSDEEGARDYLARAIELNPHFSLLHAGTARATLDELEAVVRR